MELSNCPSCSAAGHITCPSCQGWDATETGSYCEDCDDTGALECRRCLGTGVVDLDEEAFDEALEAYQRERFLAAQRARDEKPRRG